MRWMDGTEGRINESDMASRFRQGDLDGKRRQQGMLETFRTDSAASGGAPFYDISGFGRVDPHSLRATMIGLTGSAMGVRLYSTLGGTTL